MDFCRGSNKSSKNEIWPSTHNLNKLSVDRHANHIWYWERRKNKFVIILMSIKLKLSVHVLVNHNVIEYCAFVHVDLENITMGCPKSSADSNLI